MKMTDVFRTWLMEQRKALGWSRKELAERSGYSSQQIFNLEKGCREFTIHHLELFSDLFQCCVQITYDKGELSMTTPQFLTNKTDELETTLVATSFSTELTRVIASLDHAIQFIVDETEHVELEKELNDVMDKLWEKGYETETIERAKQQIVEDFLDDNEQIREFITRRQLAIVEGVRYNTDLTDKEQQQLSALCDFEFEEDHESIFGLGEDLVRLYNDLMRLSLSEGASFQEKGIFEFSQTEVR